MLKQQFGFCCVDSMCRDANTKNLNLRNSKHLSLYNNVPFTLECFHNKQHTQWCKKPLQKYQTSKWPDGQNVFLSSSSSNWLVQNCVTLSWWFFAQSNSILHLQCTSPSLFHNFEASCGGLNWSLKNHGFICNTISSLVCMHTNHLATKHNYY